MVRLSTTKKYKIACTTVYDYLKDKQKCPKLKQQMNI